MTIGRNQTTDSQPSTIAAAERSTRWPWPLSPPDSMDVLRRDSPDCNVHVTEFWSRGEIFSISRLHLSSHLIQQRHSKMEVTVVAVGGSTVQGNPGELRTMTSVGVWEEEEEEEVEEKLIGLGSRWRHQEARVLTKCFPWTVENQTKSNHCAKWGPKHRIKNITVRPCAQAPHMHSVTFVRNILP